MALESESGKTEDDFVQIGQHEALGTSWITKHYNKLGSFLHIHADSRSQKEVPLNYLKEVIAEIRRVSKSNLITSIAETLHFQCSLCGTQVTCCVEALPNLKEVVCPVINCTATFIPQKNEEGWSFKLNAVDFKCLECGEIHSVLDAELAIGVRITCAACGKRFIVSGKTWHILKEDIYQSVQAVR